MNVTIYHNPACGTSRRVLGMILDAGIEPVIVEYLKTPPSRTELAGLVARMGATARALLREKEPLCAELGLGDSALGDDALLDAIAAHPILLNRPIVTAPEGAKLCRPAETVLDILPA